MNERLKKLNSLLFKVISRKNINKWNYEPERNLPIYGLYHIYCVNAWKDLVKEQIQNLKDSGLYDVTGLIYVSVIYSQESDLNYIKNIIGGKICLISQTKDGAKFEFPALDFIHDKSKEENFLVYYFHTKGISYTSNAKDYPSKDYLKLKNCTEAWRKMMEYFIFYKWKVAVNVLKDYDTYGSYYMDPIVPPFHYKFYSGNFWWSKSDYIKILPELTEEEHKNRYLAENWLCRKAKKIFVAFNTSAELYAIEMNPKFYHSDITVTIMSKALCIVPYFFSHYKFIIKKYVFKKK